jgi:hypothetical protein
MLFSAAAHAKGVVLMLNMNYSSAELKAVEEQAAARGQRVEMVPPKEMIADVETLFAKRNALQAELIKGFPNETKPRINSAVSGIMRKGSAWDGSAELVASLGSERMDELAELTHKVFAQEEQKGSLYDQLRRKAAELKAKGDRVDTFVISSHSDGSNLTGETNNRLSADDLARLKHESPELFDSPRHVLLLGCYNLTAPNHKVWRYDLFPGASMLAGFGLRAPSRLDPTSSDFIRQTLSTGRKLDGEMAKAGRPLDPAYVDSVFKSLKTFTTKDHPGVADYCFQMVEGQPDTFTHDCDKQWEDLFLQKKKLEDYWSLRDPYRDPTTDGGGNLRAFYNALQGACPAEDAKSLPQEEKKLAERFRVTMRELVIRLIYWWNVQHNFSTYYEREIRDMNASLNHEGIGEMPKLDGTMSRVEFVNAFNQGYDLLGKANPGLQKEFYRLYAPLFFLKGEDTVAQGEAMDVESTLSRKAIPFHWIEGTTVVRKR